MADEINKLLNEYLKDNNILKDNLNNIASILKNLKLKNVNDVNSILNNLNSIYEKINLENSNLNINNLINLNDLYNQKSNSINNFFNELEKKVMEIIKNEKESVKSKIQNKEAEIDSAISKNFDENVLYSGFKTDFKGIISSILNILKGLLDRFTFTGDYEKDFEEIKHLESNIKSIILEVEVKILILNEFFSNNKNFLVNINQISGVQKNDINKNLLNLVFNDFFKLPYSEINLEYLLKFESNFDGKIFENDLKNVVFNFYQKLEVLPIYLRKSSDFDDLYKKVVNFDKYISEIVNNIKELKSNKDKLGDLLHYPDYNEFGLISLDDLLNKDDNEIKIYLGSISNLYVLKNILFILKNYLENLKKVNSIKSINNVKNKIISLLGNYYRFLLSSLNKENYNFLIRFSSNFSIYVNSIETEIKILNNIKKGLLKEAKDKIDEYFISHIEKDFEKLKSEDKIKEVCDERITHLNHISKIMEDIKKLLEDLSSLINNNVNYFISKLIIENFENENLNNIEKDLEKLKNELEQIKNVVKILHNEINLLSDSLKRIKSLREFFKKNEDILTKLNLNGENLKSILNKNYENDDKNYLKNQLILFNNDIKKVLEDIEKNYTKIKGFSKSNNLIGEVFSQYGNLWISYLGENENRTPYGILLEKSPFTRALKDLIEILVERKKIIEVLLEKINK